MTSLNKLFTQYFIIAIICILIVMILIFNFTSTIFFTEFLVTINEKNNDAIVENVKLIVEDGMKIGYFRRYLEIISIEGTVELSIYKEDKHVLSADPQKINLQEPEEKFFKESEVIPYEYSFVVDQSNYTINIYRLKDINLLDQNTKYLNNINYMYLIVFIIAILLSAILALTLSRRFNKPILTIKENINYIKQGRYNRIKITETKAKELKQLSEEINDLAKSKENEEKLRKRLSNDIVHELKTPITTLSANLEAILDGIYKADNERIKILLDQTNRLSRLVNGLSKLTILETNSDEIEKTEVNISEMIKDIKITFEPAINEKGLKSFSEIEEGILINGNEDKLLQSFVNVFSNALKYTEKGSISVKLYQKKKSIYFEISDTGIGIDEKDLPYVFERFYRADESRSRQTGGAGIGLSITRAVIQAHDGEIRVESNNKEGSKFTIRLNSIN